MNRREAIAALVAMPEVSRIAVAKPDPDDVIVVEYDGMISQEMAENIKRHFQEIWPKRRVIVLGDGLRMKFAKG